MSRHDPHLLAERLATEPPITRGCSLPEMLVIAMVCIGLFLPSGGFIGSALGSWQLGLAGGVFSIVATFAVVPGLLQRIKRDRPQSYYQHWVRTRAHDRGLWPCPYVRRSGPWDLGRSGQ
jgi:conjugative transfer region protein (TIGR03750 family)